MLRIIFTPLSDLGFSLWPFKRFATEFVDSVSDLFEFKVCIQYYLVWLPPNALL